MKFNNYITKLNEEKQAIDIPRNTLDPEVFQFFDGERLPMLRDGIRAQILTVIQSFTEFIPVVNFFIIGCILTHNWTERCPIDVYIETDAEVLDNLSVAEIMFNLQRLNSQLAIGTQHPVIYHIIPGEYDVNQVDALYDVANEKWIKIPEPLNPDISNFITRFNETISSIDITTGKIHRNLVSIDDLTSLGKTNVAAVRFELQKQFDLLQSELNYLATIYKNEVFNKMVGDTTSTTEEIRYYGSKIYLPETAILKLLQKYYYLIFLKQLEDLLQVNEKNEFNIPGLILSSRIGKYFKVN